MTCVSVVAKVMDFFDRELSPAEDKSVEEHLHLCRDCSTYLRTYRVVPVLLRLAFEAKVAEADAYEDAVERLVSFFRPYR